MDCPIGRSVVKELVSEREGRRGERPEEKAEEERIGSQGVVRDAVELRLEEQEAGQGDRGVVLIASSDCQSINEKGEGGTGVTVGEEE
jgi:hypothetical protein